MIIRLHTLGLVLAFAGFVSIALVGCSNSDSSATGDAGFTQRVENALTDARSGGADDQQIATLQQAEKTQSVSVEDMRTAAREVVDCLADHGIVGKYVEDSSNAGLVRPNYAAQLADGDTATEALIDQCDRQSFYWLNQVYTFQPVAVQGNDAYFEQQLPVLKKCVNDNGGGVADSAPTDDWLQAADTIAKDTDGQVNCFAVAKLDSF